MKASARISLILLFGLFIQCSEKEDVIVEPELITGNPSLVEAVRTYFSISGELLSYGSVDIEDHGFVYATNSQPTIDDQAISYGPIQKPLPTEEYRPERFYADLNDLVSNTDYYFKTYVQTEEGIYYGNQVYMRSLRGQWIQRSSFTGPHRGKSVTISAGNYGYLIGGLTLELNKLQDVWRYDASNDSWSQLNDFPEEVTTDYARGFAIASELYCLTDSDLWQYNVTNDEWSVIGLGVPGYQKYFTAFSIGNIIYAGNGRAPYGSNDDFYKYDFTSSEWIEIANYPGDARQQYYGVSNSTSGWVGYGGEWPDYSFTDEFYQYDPVTDEWISKSSFIRYDGRRSEMVIFEAGENIYMGMGYNVNDADFADLFEYSPAASRWVEVSSIPGSERRRSMSFTINDKGYVGLGFKYHRQGQVDKLTDLWEFDAE